MIHEQVDLKLAAYTPRVGPGQTEEWPGSSQQIDMDRHCKSDISEYEEAGNDMGSLMSGEPIFALEDRETHPPSFPKLRLNCLQRHGLQEESTAV